MPVTFVAHHLITIGRSCSHHISSVNFFSFMSFFLLLSALFVDSPHKMSVITKAHMHAHISSSTSGTSGGVGSSGTTTGSKDFYYDRFLSEMLDPSSSGFRFLSSPPHSPNRSGGGRTNHPSVSVCHECVELNKLLGHLNEILAAHQDLIATLQKEDKRSKATINTLRHSCKSNDDEESPRTPPRIHNNKRDQRSPQATPGSGERHNQKRRTDLLQEAPTAHSPSIQRSAEACDARRSAEACKKISKLLNELDAFSGLNMSKEIFDSLAQRLHRVKSPTCCCCFLFEPEHHASDPCACPNPREYKNKSRTRCVEPFNGLVPPYPVERQHEERWKQGSRSLPQIQMPAAARAACGTGGCLNFFYAIKLIVGYLQVKGGCANKTGKALLQMKDHKGRIIYFSEQNFMRAKKALVVVGLTSDAWVNWDLVPGFVDRLGGREAVRGYMRELFSSSTSSSSASSASSVARNGVMGLLASLPNLTRKEAREIFQNALDEGKLGKIMKPNV